MRKITSILSILFLILPSSTSAAALTSQQATSLITVVQSSPATPASAFVPLITAFSNITVPQAASLITVVQAAPGVPANAFVDLLTSFTVDTVAPVPVVPLTRPDTSDSPYTSSNLGYDLSFTTHDYPQIGFGFAVVGVTRGKAFAYNERTRSEYSFAQFGSTRPTLYLNLNAPYGSTATGTNISTPRTCDTLFGAATTSASSGGTYPEPTICASYNYGYNTARDAYAYTTGVGVVSPLWWLDIEDANSWSADVAVNDAVIQGAIDYLNSKDVRVGIYSVPYMWHNIAGNNFTPVQSLLGKSATVPTWFPIGIATQVNALNACFANNPLIPSSPVWIIQYEANSTAVDQNIAC